MARDKLFSPPQVLEAATDVFAERGYQGASLAVLLEATGLGKQSLYNCFGDKRSLYLQALDCAVARGAAVVERMRRAPDGRAAIDVFFDSIVSQCVSRKASERACVVSAGLLEGIDDDAIRQRLTAYWAATHEMLRETVERAQKDGSAAHRGPSATLADHLMCTVSGMRVMARTGGDERRLRRTARLATAVLDRDDDSRAHPP